MRLSVTLPTFASKRDGMTRQFFNMIAGKDGAACLLLYGNIGTYEDVRSGDIVRELLEIEATYPKVDVRINSMGGEVYAGIAIFNALRNSRADITIYIDGIAASIASVIAACGKPVHMSRFARLMIHSVSGGCWGDKDDLRKCIDEIDALEGTLADIYASRTGKTAGEVRAEWFDGEEHWFTADEALAAGLVDGVYDTEPVPEDSTPRQVYEIYQNRLNPDKMLIDELKKRPSFANVAGDEEVLTRVGRLETEAAKVSGTKKAELIPMKQLLPVTGYIRGGCSPIGMKKAFPTYLHESAARYPFIYVSAGVRGLQIRIAPADLVAYARCALCPIATS